MTTLCHPLPADSAQDFLALAARAMCDRPGETPAQGESRTRQMVHTVMGFEPRSGLEYMLAAIAVGHFHMILDSIRDVFQGGPDSTKLRAQSGIVALDRAMLSMIRELRTERKRSAAGDRVGPDARAASPETAPHLAPDPAPGRAPMANAGDRRPASTGPSALSRMPPSPAAAKARPAATRPDPDNSGPHAAPIRKLALVAPDFPPGDGAEDDPLLTTHLAAFEQAFADALCSLSEAAAAAPSTG